VGDEDMDFDPNAPFNVVDNGAKAKQIVQILIPTNPSK